MRVTADRARCIGSGNCTLTAPDIFDSGEDGLVDVLTDEPAEDRIDDVRTAVCGCPVAALTVHTEPPDRPVSGPA